MKTYIPYGRQSISEEDIQAVVGVLRSDFLTTGPAVSGFEKQTAEYTGSRFGVAFSSGTAALHGAAFAMNIQPGDEVIVPAITFAATSNAVVYQGGRPVFCDVESDTLLMDPAKVEALITDKTRAVIAVDYAGQPCDYDALRRICDAHELLLVADACHSLGGRYKGRMACSLADMSILSFHPVKHITTGEGGMVLTDNKGFESRLKMFRNHGITTDYRQREQSGSWYYEMRELGYNYRITDIQCALGMSQLKRLDAWIGRRQAIAARYDRHFSASEAVAPLSCRPDVSHAYHLYVVRLRGADRGAVFSRMRNSGIGVNVHYLPVYRHPYYSERLGYRAGLCPVAEDAYEHILSLPMFPGLNDAEVDFTAEKLLEACSVSV